MLLFCWSWSWWYSTVDISLLGQCRLNHIFILFHEKPIPHFKLNNFSLPTNSRRSLHVIIENVCLEIVGSHQTAPRRQIWSLRIKRHSLSYNQWTSIMLAGRRCLSGRLSNKWQFLLLKGDRKLVVKTAIWLQPRIYSAEGINDLNNHWSSSAITIIANCAVAVPEGK